MKHYKLLLIATTALTLGSCSIFNQKGKTVNGSEAIVRDKTETNAKQSKPETDIAESITGEWIIVSAGGKQIPSTDDMPYVTFEKPTGKLYASDGCNIINGSYKINPDGTVSFDNVISTMKFCGDLEYDNLISLTLASEEPVNVKIEKVGQESFIRFYNQKGKEIMSARKHNMDFLNGNWQIISVNGKAIDGDEANIFIDINELKVHGNTGCNFFNGQLYINPDKSNAIDFSNLASTRMLCHNMDQESAIFLALEETTTAIEGSEGRVMLLNSAGKELMSLRKAAPKAE